MTVRRIKAAWQVNVMGSLSVMKLSVKCCKYLVYIAIDYILTVNEVTNGSGPSNL